MSELPSHARRIVLASRPKGAPIPENFRLEETALPALGDGQVLLRILWLSLDPYMRGRMSDAPSYAAPVEIDAPMIGGTVAEVVASKSAKAGVGDLVLSMSGWQDYAVTDDKGFRVLPAGLQRQPSYAVGVLGMPGMTAYMGLLDIGAPKPGETVVVAAATGAVGSVVGQIAKLKGCSAIGIAGGGEKCAFAVDELGFDACVDHRAPDLAQRLTEACPKGIDVYFENVGGAVFQAVLPLLNQGARIPVCGLIAHYNAEHPPEGPDRTPVLMRAILTKRIRMQGFIVTDYNGRLPEFERDMPGWVESGRIKAREDVVEGLENAPEALIGLLQGKNFGKLVVRVAQA